MDGDLSVTLRIVGPLANTKRTSPLAKTRRTSQSGRGLGGRRGIDHSVCGDQPVASSGPIVVGPAVEAMLEISPSPKPASVTEIRGMLPELPSFLNQPQINGVQAFAPEAHFFLLFTEVSGISLFVYSQLRMMVHVASH